jgi:hypothetical protein
MDRPIQYDMRILARRTLLALPLVGLAIALAASWTVPAGGALPTAVPLAAALLPLPVRPDFWPHWSDGKAEMNGYRLTQPRYGVRRAGTAALIFVTEDFSDSVRVKADPGKHPPSDVYPVWKLNTTRDFQTGIYGYNVMTSVFARVAPGFPLAKVSFSSQEWCGHVYHQLLPRAGRLKGVSHSYFDGEADATEDLDLPAGGVLEDALPLVLRGWTGAYLEPGESRTVPFLPSLLSARLEHKPLRWGKARISRSSGSRERAAPAGRYSVDAWTVAVEGGPTLTYEIEAAAPFRLVRWSADTGEEGVLTGSTRLAYWKLNGPGGEKRLAEMGLPVPVLK